LLKKELQLLSRCGEERKERRMYYYESVVYWQQNLQTLSFSLGKGRVVFTVSALFGSFFRLSTILKWTATMWPCKLLGDTARTALS
jgi:hypothetical protein